MYLETARQPKEPLLSRWESFLRRMNLEPDLETEYTAMLMEDGAIAACGSRSGNVLKCIAVDPAFQGEGLTGTLLTHLRQEAFEAGFQHLFLYTKPRNRHLFEPLFFYPVAQTRDVLLMENRRNGIRQFLEGLAVPRNSGKIGAIVMHADPFTRGHLYLAEQAAGECDWLYIFVLSEDRGCFRSDDRLRMVRRGVSHLANVTVHPTGPYLISAATFPSYFLKDRGLADRAHCQLDLTVFAKWFAPHFGITCRFAGSEPNCPVTRAYNEEMARCLPACGIEFREIRRLEADHQAISAGVVRSRIETGEDIQNMVPKTTYTYLQEINRI